MTAQKIGVMGMVMLLLAACASGSENRNDTAAGVGLGALFGAVVGAAIGGEEGALLGAAIGAAAGGIIGAEIDRRDEERHQAALADAYRLGQSQSWSNPDTGNSGQIAMRSRDEASKCMEVDFTYNQRDGGAEEYEGVTYCDKGDGFEEVG